MPVNIIVLSKGKLISVDGAVPVVLELKKRYPACAITFVLVSEAHRELIKKNYILWEAIRSVGARVCVVNHPNRIIRLLRVARFIARYAFRRTVIIKDGDMLPWYARLLGLLKMTAPVTEVKAYFSMQTDEGYMHTAIQTAIAQRRQGKSEELNFFGGSYERFLSPLSTELFKRCFNVNAPREKMLTTGYLRRLPAWTAFMHEAADRNRAVNSGPYILYILTCLGRVNKALQEPEMIELLQETLEILKPRLRGLRTVFKPHATTDVARVEALLRRVEYPDWSIDYGHPMVLSKKAAFIIGNMFSCAMFDAYYLGRPVIEYSYYDKQVHEALGGRSYGGSCCDFFIRRDGLLLGQTVDGLLSGRLEVQRDAAWIEANFRPTNPDFFGYWDRLLTAKK